jgi:N6-adenosine-specific RNA methylase IME4
MKEKFIKYSVIYADPPWNQKAGREFIGYKKIGGKQIWNTGSNLSRDLPYKTMSIEDIASLPVKSIVEKNAFLFMWVTNKHLMNAEKVITAWGFKYVACITWEKKRLGGGLGGVVRINSEYLLFCRRGHLKAKGTIPVSVIEAKRPYRNGYPCHSKKPEYFRSLIETICFPEYKKLEMFAREQYPCWDVFGDEIENSIKL